MALFGKRKSPSAPMSTAQMRSDSVRLASASSLPEPTTDWTDPANVRAEWQGQLEGEDEGLLGWRNGMRLFEGEFPPGQAMNIAEYMTRGLGYHLFTPVISDADAAITARRILQLVDAVPAEPPFLAEFAPRLSRLALTIIREKGWQATALGGDGSITDEIVGARSDGLVVYSAQCPGVTADATWPHFFGEG